MDAIYYKKGVIRPVVAAIKQPAAHHDDGSKCYAIVVEGDESGQTA
jgi:hypothetical protein